MVLGHVNKIKKMIGFRSCEQLYESDRFHNKSKCAFDSQNFKTD